MCAVGKHRSGATRFVGNMNIPSSLHRTSWTNHINQIKKATEKVADQSMRMAAYEIRAASNSSDITVSNDGTYHRRGFQSKNGVVTTLTVNGKDSKVLDTHVMSNHCDACSKQKKKNVPPEEQREWEVKHERDCEKNHNGCAAKIEPDGTEVIFRRSVDKYNLRYTKFLSRWRQQIIHGC
jgi:hypothetical protein